MRYVYPNILSKPNNINWTSSCSWYFTTRRNIVLIEECLHSSSSSSSSPPVYSSLFPHEWLATRMINHVLPFHIEKLNHIENQLDEAYLKAARHRRSPALSRQPYSGTQWGTGGWLPLQKRGSLASINYRQTRVRQGGGRARSTLTSPWTLEGPSSMRNRPVL